MCNIPLHKINESPFKEFVHEFTGFTCPDESTARKLYVDKIYEEKFKNLQALVRDRKVYLVFDETPDSQHRLVFNNIMVGVLSEDLDESKPPYIFHTTFLKNACNSETVSQAVIRGLQCLYLDGIQFNDILLILTDGAPYMIKAVSGLTSSLISNAIHLTCLAHGIHRVAECVRASFPQIDTLVSTMKKVLVKAPKRRVQFVQSTGLPLPPEPIIVRWCTWIEAVQYYAKNFEMVKRFVMELPNDAACIETAKEVLHQEGIVEGLVTIVNNYSCLCKAIKEMEKDSIQLSHQVQIVENLKAQLPPLSCAKTKLENVLSKNPGYHMIKKMADVLSGCSKTLTKSFGPTDILAFKYAPLSSAWAERSFSKYRDLLTDKRTRFSEENLAKHLFVQMNKASL